MKTKISNEEIGEVVRAALRKKSMEEPRLDIKKRFQLCGQTHVLKFTRRYHRGHVSLCNPAACDAGDDCCHLRKVKGIDLCYTGSDDFELLKHKGEHIVIDNIDESTENKIFNAVDNVLDLISEQALEGKGPE